MRLRPAATNDDRSPASPGPTDPQPMAAPTPVTPTPATEGPSVSVVVPVEDGARFLGDAVASALAQTSPPEEIVVVDSGPPGGPGSIIEAAAIDGVRYVRHDGSGASLWNRGLEESSGEIVIVLDPDDILLGDAVETHRSTIRDADAPVLSVGDLLVLDDQLAPCDEAFWGDRSAVEHLADGDWLPGGVVAIDRRALAMAGDFSEALAEHWFAEWLAVAVGQVELVPAGRHTLARRGIGFDDGDAATRLTVVHTLLATVGPGPVAGASDDDPISLVEVGLRLLRLGDAAGALVLFEEAETAASAEGSELASTVRSALAAGDLETVRPHPVRSFPPPLGVLPESSSSVVGSPMEMETSTVPVTGRLFAGRSIVEPSAV